MTELLAKPQIEAVTGPRTDPGMLENWAVAGICLLVLVGCSREESFDYCKHHYQVHEGHQADIARLHGQLSAEGVLTMQLQLPTAVLGYTPHAAESSSVLGQLLQSADAVYRLQSDQPCSAASVQVKDAGSGSGGLQLEYRSECGAGNSIRQVDVALFDVLEGLEEVEVQMDTPATSKHFAISRLCKQAIFRLKPH